MVTSLAGKRGLIIGIANENSIAWGCAQAMHVAGAELAITYLNAKAERFVRPLAESVSSPIILPLNVEQDGELEQVFQHIHNTWGKLDFLVHAIAFARGEDLNGRVTDCSREGFLQAMDISCHSFMRMARLAEPLMPEGGSLISMSYLGAERAVRGYGLMGPVKAALESSIRYMAQELGEKRIRVNGISAGLIPTRAGKGIAAYAQMEERARAHTPLPDAVTITDVGAYAAFLVSDGAKAITGTVQKVDGGYHCVE